MCTAESVNSGGNYAAGVACTLAAWLKPTNLERLIKFVTNYAHGR